MKKKIVSFVCILFVLAFCFHYAEATDVTVTFTELTGLTGGSIPGTGVFRATITGLTSLQSITITDNSFGLGGSPGQFSGFDLDAIKLSFTSVGTAAAAQALAGLSSFDFSTAGTFFTPGAQRAPVDPKLFGTGPAGNTVNNAVATLGLFDGESTTAIPGAFGFISMGDGGKLSFNLTSAVTLSAPLYLYIGEVGNNGEVAAGNIKVSDAPVTTPEPTTMLLVGFGLIGLAGVRKFKK